MNWIEIAVTVSSEGEEAVTDLFYRTGCQGVVVEDPSLIQTYIQSGIWDYHVFENLEVTGRSIVKGYFPEDERLDARRLALREELLLVKDLFPDWDVQSEAIIVKEEDWANEWKRYFKPVRVGKHFLIQPTWEEVQPLEDDLVIKIDPGMAFGTGTHATTSLCLEAIEEHVREGQLVFDIGTGSGILAVAAAKKGAYVQAGDIDLMAVRIAQENVDLNEVTRQVEVRTGDLGEVFTGQADVVIANIIADVIIELLPQIPKILKKDGLFIASGIIESRVEDVLARIEELGFSCVERSEEAGWVLLEVR